MDPPVLTAPLAPAPREAGCVVARGRLALVTIGIAALALGAWLRRDQLVAGASELGDVSAVGLLALLAITAAQVGTRVWAFTCTVPGLPKRRAYVASEASTAATNGLVGGGMVGAGLKVGMMRSWGVAPEAIAVSLVATGAAASIAMWLLAVMVAGGSVAAGQAATLEVAVLGVGTAVLAATAVVGTLLLRHEPLTDRLAASAAQGLGRAGSRWRWIPQPDVVAATRRARTTARLLVRHQGVRILAVSLLGHVLLAGVLLVAVRAVGAHEVGALDALVASSLVRVAASVTPAPGGVGVTEVGLVAMLSTGSGAQPQVVAAVMAYRACTFVLPILTGTACVVAWRWRRRRRERIPT